MAQRVTPQNKEALLKYNKRLRDDVKSMLDNYTGKIERKLQPNMLMKQCDYFRNSKAC